MASSIIFLQTDLDCIPVMDWRCEEEESARSGGALREVCLPSRWETLLNSWWWIIRFRLTLPGGMNLHTLHKNDTATSAGQHHDSRWLIRCGSRWGTMIYICAQRERFFASPSPSDHQTGMQNLMWYFGDCFTSFWIQIFGVLFYLYSYLRIDCNVKSVR